MDATCIKCGEVWDTEEFNATERRNFYAGKGCPACEFGTTCPDCSGTGIERTRDYRHTHCPHCLDSHYIFVREAAWFPGVWHYDYIPNVKSMPVNLDIVIGNPTVEYCREGQYKSIKVHCPFCTGAPCPSCNGTGQFTRKLEGEELERAMWDTLESTDEEPIGILHAMLDNL